jgi:DNA-directed RNA polymerase subunit E'/Rpb7
MLNTLRPELFANDKFGVITVKDILVELEKPGRDPRPDFKVARFNDGVDDIRDLKEGMILEGTVSNVAAFGAFIDLGVHQDGLVHVSQLSNKFITDAREVVKTGDIVKVKVTEVGREDLDEEFLTEISSLESDVAKIEQLSDAYLLNLSQLALTRLKSLAQWDFDLAEAELKILCANHEGIEGVCSWLRKEASTSKFDVDTFANENIELWLEFTLPRETYTRLIVNKKKA